MGRPKKTRPERLSLRLDASLHEAIAEAASAAGVTITSMVHMLLTESIDRRVGQASRLDGIEQRLAALEANK